MGDDSKADDQKAVERQPSMVQGGIKDKFLSDGRDNKLMEAFKRADADGSGEISYAEFNEIVQDVGLAWDPDVVKKIFKKMDVNKSKSIDYKEFKAGVSLLGSSN